MLKLLAAEMALIPSRTRRHAIAAKWNAKGARIDPEMTLWRCPNAHRVRNRVDGSSICDMVAEGHKSYVSLRVLDHPAAIEVADIIACEEFLLH